MTNSAEQPRSPTVDAFEKALAFANNRLLFGRVQHWFGPVSYAFVDRWVVSWTSASIICYVGTLYLNHPLLYFSLSIISGLRLLECFFYQLYVVLFAQYRVQIDRWLYSYRRSVILLLLNYIECVFWFAFWYSMIMQCGGLKAPEPHAFSLLRESLILMVANSTGMVTPTSTLAWAVMTAHGAIGLTMTVVVLSRFLSLLPRPGSMDRTEDESR